MLRKTENIKEASEVIRDGGVVLCPSEGVYGLSCDAFNEEAVKRVIAIKERSDAKGFITVSDSLKRAESMLDLSSVSEGSKDLMSRLWPGPFTFILPVNSAFRSLLTGFRNTIALRITGFETLRALCGSLANPIVSTSANISGKQAVSKAELLDPEILERVDLFLSLPCEGLQTATSIYDTLEGRLIRRGVGWPEGEDNA